MGVRLMVEVLDCAEELTPAERLLLVALAEKADDATRRVLWGRGDDPRAVLRRRTGQSSSGLTKTFRRLAERDLDPRVPLATDRHGRPVFAYEGAAAEYVVPTLRACPTGQALLVERLPWEAVSRTGEGALQGPSGYPLGHPPEPERVPSRAPHVPPSLEEPSIDARESVPAEAPSPLALVPDDQRPAVLELITRLGQSITEADAIDCAAWVATHRTPDNLRRYLSPFTAEDVRTRAAERRDQAKLTSDPRKCDHGVIHGHQVLGSGANASRRCDRCEQLDPAEHAVAVQARATDTRAAGQ